MTIVYIYNEGPSWNTYSADGIKYLFDGERREVAIDNDAIFIREKTGVEVLDETFLGPETIGDDVEAAVEKTKPLGELGLMI